MQDIKYLIYDPNEFPCTALLPYPYDDFPFNRFNEGEYGIPPVEAAHFIQLPNSPGLKLTDENIQDNQFGGFGNVEPKVTYEMGSVAYQDFSHYENQGTELEALINANAGDPVWGVPIMPSQVQDILDTTFPELWPGVYKVKLQYWYGPSFIVDLIKQ